jgi:hypothetical protein
MSDVEKLTGGFPPIFRCAKKDLFTIKENKNREFKGVSNTVSIKDIMNKRKIDVPFI